MLCKCRRVENDEVIVVVAGVCKIFKCIFSKSLVARVVTEIQLYIAVGELNGFLRTVHRVYKLCTTSHCIE